MHVEPLDMQNRQDVRRFMEVPFRVYHDKSQWVPPLETDARRMLDRRQHPFYRHSEAGFFLALDDTAKPVGRIAVLHNRPFNEFNKQRTAFFYLFECLEEPDAARALFEAAFDWARVRGLSRIQGPKGFSALDGTGILVAGFEHRPALGIPYNPPYYAAFVEAAGFEPMDEVVSGYLSADMPFPDSIHRASEIIQRRRGLRVARFRTRRDLRAFIPRLQALYNASLAGTVDNTPLSDEDARAMAQQLLWFANPRLIKVLMKGDDPVGFLFAYPDVSAALQRTRGRIWPFGWVDLLLELRRTKWININGAAIVERYRGLGGTAILFSEMQRSVLEGGFQHADLVQVGVYNDPIQRELRGLGIEFYKRHRSYARNL
jgi:GNAT superfamily N-acetyltransferase